MHQGLLEISGNPFTGLTFTTRADKLNLALEAEKDDLVEISRLGVSAAGPPTQPAEGVENPATSAGPSGEVVEEGRPDPVHPPASNARAADLQLVFLALRKLGYTGEEASGRVREAIRRLEGRKGPVRAEEILRAAIGARLAPDRNDYALQDSG